MSMDFMDYVEFDHAANRHDDAYLDRLGYPRTGSHTWTKEEMIEWNRQRDLDSMPDLDTDEP